MLRNPALIDVLNTKIRDVLELLIDVKIDCNRFCNRYNVLQARLGSIRRFGGTKFEHIPFKKN